MKDLYKIFGLEKGASKEQVDASYNKLKSKLLEDRFLPGAKGNEAACKLTEIETSYKLISKDFEDSATIKDFATINELIGKGEFTKAQEALDAFSNHTAEWHYMQAMLFYRREWTNEAKIQLEIAVNMESNNVKYMQALERLKFVIGNKKTDPNTLNRSKHPKGSLAESTDSICGPCANCCLCAVCMDCCCGCGRMCGNPD